MWPIAGEQTMKFATRLTLVISALNFATTGCKNVNTIRFEEERGTELKQGDPDPVGTPSAELPTHHQGAVSGLVRIELYTDLECPPCHDLYHQLQNLMQAHDDVELIYHPYPLSSHQHAMKAAEAVECAAEIGGEDAFWALHDVIVKVDDLSDFLLKTAARGIGLDGQHFDDCLTSGKYVPLIHAARNAAPEIRGTPTYFVNGTKFEGVGDYSELEDAYTAAVAPAP